MTLTEPMTDRPAPTRDRILRAAMELVSEDGFRAATTAAIARRAGVAEGTLYRHFDSKDGLFVAVYSGIKERLHNSVVAETDQDAPLETRFRQLWKGVWSAYKADPAAFTYGQRFAETPLMGTDSHPIHNGFARHVGTMIRDGQASGEIKAVPAPILLAFFFPPMVSMLRQTIAGYSWTADEIDTAIQTAWDAWHARR